MSEEKKSRWRGAVEKVAGQIETQKAQKAASAAQAGSLVIQKSFGTSTIAIYDGGFVRVSKVLNSMTALTPYEKLRSIKYSEQVQDRGSLSNAAYRLPGASKQKRSLYLTIATDRKVHTLSTEAEVLGGDVKSGRALEAAGQAVLDSHGSSAAATAQAGGVPPTAAPDIADQIKKLADLHAAGILTDDEFATKKADLLHRM